MKRSEPTQLAPVHVNIRHLWLYNIRALLLKPKIRVAFNRLQITWIDIVESKRDDAMEFDWESAHEEFALDLHIGQVRIKDWHWVANTFEHCQIADVQLAICEEVYPDRAWEVIESDLHTVVTDKERSLVCDVQLCDKLSASASLLLAGDTKLQYPKEVLEEVLRHRQGQIELTESRLRKVTEHLAKHSYEAEILPFQKDDK